MSTKKENDLEKKKKKFEQDEMQEESHQLELMEGYEQDETDNESKN